ncbi:hypothetical protein SERLA73DRAFT_178909 [Serpula lacrymans var. lacrymans S7.3]|uniref:Uncharacterized protein n=2 Tax=Serpula lacrymans var. lacrymans TaxID=341189 RepID=F8PT81_SERL3|nr:uncharacterized protein SERLADRAFT_463700 [Serpula lacrymans var. lacrymans S7.9]EGO00911.1 hypothetical protein SERLA73DRAFT_178909 [Serpula lacrymans var. lacrymans S7.3]EGO26528.1 hypothetical protein SERLADRAFT_463700 [Serpula lacrymans var. lacrymans S7.9]
MKGSIFSLSLILKNKPSELLFIYESESKISQIRRLDLLAQETLCSLSAIITHDPHNSLPTR